jgi:hypothetical protein
MKNILFSVSSHDHHTDFIVSEQDLTPELQQMYYRTGDGGGIYWNHGYPEYCQDMSKLTLQKLPTMVDVVIHVHCYL